MPDLIQNMLDRVEGHRGEGVFPWPLFVALKDFLWRLANRMQALCSRMLPRKPDLRAYKKVSAYRKVSFCITSMNRLQHVRRTLIKNIEHNLSYPNVEFVLLDYNSGDGLERWVRGTCGKYLESGILKYHRTTKPVHFHMAHAKNMAHKLATGDILCSLDADNFTSKNFAFFINFTYEKNRDCVGVSAWGNHKKSRLSDFGGRIFLSRDNFERVGGYDEEFVGWGYEDLDFKQRAVNLGLKMVSIPVCFLGCIKHEDSLRERHMPLSKKESNLRNKKLFEKKHPQRSAF
jgi:hypothetical protein